MTTQHLDDHGQQIHPPPPSLGNADVPNPEADGAPPVDQDPIAIHFAEHKHGPVEGCKMCDDAAVKLWKKLR